MTTNNYEAEPEPSVIARLRRLTPNRPLSLAEARAIAELQATHFLKLLDVAPGRVSERLIADLPRIAVSYRDDLYDSGKTRWNQGNWEISINANEPPVRRRFTLAHEFRHVLDASHQHAIFSHLPAGWSRYQHIETICNHFAACLLMPRTWVEEQWHTGTQDLAALARHFDVSQQAMWIRLQVLGLIEPAPACVPAVGRTALRGGLTRRPRTGLDLNEPDDNYPLLYHRRDGARMSLLSRALPAALHAIGSPS